MGDIQDDIKEIFQRVGKLETAAEVFKQAKEFFSTEVETLKKLFEKHAVDEEKRFEKHATDENERFEEFSQTQKQILRFMYIGLGVGMTIQIVVMPLVLYILLGKS